MTRIEEINGRYQAFADVDGREKQIAECKTREAAERVLAGRERDIAANTAEREARRVASIERDNETHRLMAAIRPRLRKTVSREPGFSVNRLGDRCVAVPTYWGAPVRTCIVVMRDADGDMSGTLPLTADDLIYVEIAIDTDYECRDIVSRHAEPVIIV